MRVDGSGRYAHKRPSNLIVDEVESTAMPPVPATHEAIAEAGRLLRAGRLVALPTETVYGLGADASNGLAVAAIFAAKGRPRFNPLIVHVASLAAAERLAEFDDVARALATAFWPGGLTLVLAARRPSRVSELATAGLATIALRVPSNAIARAVIVAAGCPIAAPSANRSGHVSPTMAAHVAADLGDRVALILDGGPCAHGIESTIVAPHEGAALLLRPGAIASEAIEAVLGRPLAMPATESDNAPHSPGRLASHYATRARLRLDAREVREGEALLGFGPEPPRPSGPSINLSPSGDLREAAARLFAALRELDASGAATIAVMPIPLEGLGAAINDRLRRAAAR